MNITDLVPAIEHTLAILGGLLFINQLRLRRKIDKGLFEVQGAIVEVAAQTTVIEQDLSAFADIAENTEMLITQCGGDIRALERKVDEAVNEATREASTQAMGSVRQMVQNMTLGKFHAADERLARLEKACQPLPELPKHQKVSPDLRGAIEGKGPSHILHGGQAAISRTMRERLGDDMIEKLNGGPTDIIDAEDLAD